MPKQPLVAQTLPNHIWTIDFIYDALYSGKAFRSLNVIDKSNHEALTIEIDLSLPAARVIRVLAQLEEIHDLPEAIRLNNGPKLRAAVFTEWCESKGFNLKYIQPGKHHQNAFIERFKRTYRHEALNAILFNDLEHPHGSLGKLPSKSFRHKQKFIF